MSIQRIAVRRAAVVLVCLLCGLIVVPAVWAAVISGTIESVSADRKKITVKPGGDKPKQVYSIADGTNITLDGRPVKLGELQVGQQVSVFTSSGESVTRLTVRSGESKPAAPPATTPTPKTTPKSKKTDSADSPSDDASGGKPGDSPQFRGPRRDGHAGSANNISNSWPSSGPKPAWSANGLGAGFSAVSVANGRIYTMGLNGADEKVFALNERDGRPAWSVSTGGGAYKDGTGDGPRCTPTVDGERLYALGALGDLVCLDAKTGQRRWSKNILKEFGGNAGHWGICESPLIDSEKVIVTPGGRGATMVALNKNNGNMLW